MSLVICFIFLIYDRPNLLWNKTYGGSGNDGSYSVVEHNDGGLAVLGYTDSFWTGRYLWLVRTDGDGNQLWDQSLGGGRYESGQSVIQSEEGGFVIAGVSQSFSGDDLDMWVVQIPSDASGELFCRQQCWG